MDQILPKDRRHSTRIPISLPIRFSVNDGDEYISATIDVTHKSIGVRTTFTVTIDDLITFYIDELPPLYGRVVRQFDGGFAVKLTQSSYGLIAHANLQDRRLNKPRWLPARKRPLRYTSPLFSLNAPMPAWGRIRTSFQQSRADGVHIITILISEPVSKLDFADARFIVDRTTWIADFLTFFTRNQHTMMSFSIDDWQLSLLSVYGFNLTASNADKALISISSDADPFTAYVEALGDGSVARLSA